jgi:nickel-dependent lactate racemase
MNYGRQRIDLEIDAKRVLSGARPADSGVADPAEAVREALETPFEYPALRQALTPDDHVTVIIDEHLPNLAQLLIPVLEHLIGAGIAAEAVTILVPPSTTGQPWVNDLPDEFQEARVEVHDPSNRKRLRYLATTRGGRRLYLNQHIVDADLVVVLAGRRYDPVLGYSAQGRLAVPDDDLWPAAEEAAETAWLLGAPFFIQVIEASGDGVAAVIAGSIDASAEGRQQLDLRWSQQFTAAADIVVAGLSGDPGRHTFADLAAAAANAARVVRAGGRIVLLSEVSAVPGPEFDALRRSDDPGEVASELGPTPTLAEIPAARWAEAAGHARLTVLSQLDAEMVEDLSATPLLNAALTQRLLDAGGTCLFLDDAHKAMTALADDFE